MDSESEKALIVGLGNPGKKYEMTRHNLGQVVLSAFAKRCSFSFNKERYIELSGALTIKKRLNPLMFRNLSIAFVNLD